MAESRQKEKLEKENIKARYDILKNQISPHFLFNCFNTLSVLIDESKQAANNFLSQLSKVYRFVLETKESEIIKLKEELGAFKAYANLLRIRFGDSFVLNNRITTKEDEFFIAPMTMQILLENALKHNQSTQEKPLNVDISIANQRLIFTNSLAPVGQTDSTNTGLENIKSRYYFLTGGEVKVSRSANQFSVSVPLIQVKTA